jgi:peptidoglycan/LPS O-acetylase OafA/YrhL
VDSPGENLTIHIFMLVTTALVLPKLVLIVVSQIEHDLLRYGMMAIKCAIYFFAGYSAYKLTILMPESKYWRIVAHSMLPLIIFTLWLKRFYFKVPLPFLVVVLNASLFRSGNIWIYSNPLSVYLGKISFSLYMCHIMVFFSYRQITGGVQPLRIEIPMIFLAAIILYHFVEEPSRKLMRKFYVQTRNGKLRDTTASGAIG